MGRRRRDRSTNGGNIAVTGGESGHRQYQFAGGDLFEGLTIYNQLREYPGKVTVKILGLAASAASIIAMSGDEIQIGRSAFLMIHNTWGMAVGHRHDFADMAEKMAPFDLAMREIYVARTGMDETTITEMMDKETWMNGGEAIEKGFADALLPADSTQQDNDSPIAALRKLDALLAKANTPRAERRGLLNALRGDMPGAIPPLTVRPALPMRFLPRPGRNWTMPCVVWCQYPIKLETICLR